MIPKIIISFLIFCAVTVSAQTPASADSMNITPNPFTQRTAVSYTLAVNDTVSILVYNMAGMQIITLRNDSAAAAGAYQDSLIMDSYQPGVYIVRFTTKGGSSLLKKIVKQGPVGFMTISGTEGPKVFPNPFSDKLTFTEEGGNGTVTVTVFDLLGQPVFYRDSVASGTLDLGLLGAGTYYLMLRNEAGTRFLKVIKQ